jgi:hypothetical protein
LFATALAPLRESAPGKQNGVCRAHLAATDDISDARRSKKIRAYAGGSARAATIQGNSMINRFNSAVLYSAKKMTSQSGVCAIVIRDTIGSLLTTAHHTLLFFGFCAITVLGLMFVKPNFTNQLRDNLTLLTQTQAPAQPLTTAAESISTDTSTAATLQTDSMDMPGKPFASDSTQPTTPAIIASLGKTAKINPTSTQRQQQWVTDWLSKRYRVAGDAANMLVATTYLTAKEIQLDPLLILAVMAIESGLNPFAESPMGAQGLMQVMSKIHHQKFQQLGGVKEALNPVANIKVGSLILKDYVTRGGSIEAGLKSYVGAAAFENDAGYGSRVLAEYQRLKEVATGKNVSIFMTSSAPTPQKLRTDESKINGPDAIVPALQDQTTGVVRSNAPEQVHAPMRKGAQMAAL